MATGGYRLFAVIPAKAGIHLDVSARWKMDDQLRC
jgi:hypothetical protein